MESRWAQLGFIGFILLAVYGLVYLTIYSLPETFFGAQLASSLALLLGCLAGVGGILSSLGFIAYFSELGSRYAGLASILGILGWGLQFEAHLSLAAGFLELGAAQYSIAALYLMVTFLVWGVTLFTTRKRLPTMRRYAAFAALLFLINALAWVGYLGIPVLAVASLLQAFVLVPPVEFLGLPSPAHLLTPKRKYQIGQLGLALLALYCVLAVRWLVNGVFPLPLLVAAPLNFVALVSVWLAVLGVGIAFSRFETNYANPTFGYAGAIGIGGLLLLSLADFTWLMSNISFLADPLWGLLQYWAAPYFWLWSNLPLFLSSLLGSVAFEQEYRRARRKGAAEAPILAFALLTFASSAVAWLYGLGYIPLIVAAPVLLKLFMRQERSSWQTKGSE
jgi:hypothetical protein